MGESNKRSVELIITRMRKVSEDAAGLADELEAILSGDKTTGQLVNRLIKYWLGAWRERHAGRVYVFTARGAAAGSLKKLLASGMTVEDIEARVSQYLESRDPFYVTARHSFELFIKSINRFPGLGTTEDDDAGFLSAPAFDCSHHPACRSAQEHTRRRGQEMRS